ncbi:DUF2066 domain-containing protein [Oceanospirillum maris]|uniref:DUF2066 domain-containing protein n=1 Tax=Oceanospirillum maris TaxID=64977 RepID=UPI0004822128|nr:DUF2066 domain-containing protein [Oceanospirillum maris]
MVKFWVSCLATVLLITGVIFPAMAVQIDGLFESERFVSDQSVEQRKRAAKAGLSEVLVRVSGHKSTLRDKSVQKLLENAESYLAQFSYHENADTAKQSRYRLKMRFEGKSLVALLSQSKLSVWGGNRPNVLAWLAIDGPNGRFVVNSENNPLLSEVFEAEGQRRGVPILLPLMDLDDERLISVSDIWGQFSDRISAASVRYAPDAIYSGRFYRSGSGWRAHWLMQAGNQRQVIELQSDQIRELFTKSVDALAEILAKKYAVVVSPTHIGDYAFNVVGIKSIADYSKLNHYLGSLQIVERVEIARIDDSGVAYRVALKGDRSQFLSVLALDSFLESDKATVDGLEQSFFWRP